VEDVGGKNDFPQRLAAAAAGGNRKLNGGSCTSILKAGQNIDVGCVEVSNDATNLNVKYVIDGGWCMTESHLDVQVNHADIPQTSKGNPIPGRFEYKADHESCVQAYTYTIPMLEACCGDGVEIAAHAVVTQYFEEGQANLDSLKENLPETAVIYVTHPGTTTGDPSYWDIVIGDGPLAGSYDGNCIDTDNTMSSGQTYTVRVFSSYDENVDWITIVEYPGNLDLVNYVINQEWLTRSSSSCGGVYNYGEVQRAIWQLIEDTPSTAGLGTWTETRQCRADEIYNDALANGDGFVPKCGDKIAVVFVPENEQVIFAQVIFGGVEVSPCVVTYAGEETAWGEGTRFAADRGSWATYFTHQCGC
jgi:hypothetical protein